MDKIRLKEFMNKIKNTKEVDNYHTGLVGEKLIVASYETMPLEKLEALRFILNGIIKKKKEALRGWDKDEPEKPALHDAKKTT